MSIENNNRSISQGGVEKKKEEKHRSIERNVTCGMSSRGNECESR
jgi:hypothetical protein